MIIQRKIGLVIMMTSIFILLSAYFFTVPDKSAGFVQRSHYVSRIGIVGSTYNPRLSELVVSNHIWTTIDEFSIGDTRRVLIDFEKPLFSNNNPDFYGIVIRYNYLATICLFFFFVGLYMFVVSQNQNAKS